MPTRFRITTRCGVDDLKLASEDVGREARFITAQHEAVRVFLGKRSEAPGSGENVLNVTPYGHIKSLHVGNGRAATIYDPHEDVCWLLAFSSTHAMGERRDAYAHFEHLDSRDQLLPTADDYEALAIVTGTALVDTLREQAGNILAEARCSHQNEAGLTFSLCDGRDVRVAVAVELVLEGTASAEQGWLSVTFEPDSPVEQDTVLDLVADLIPAHVAVDDIEPAFEVRGRPIAFNEVAVTWSAYN